MNSIIPQINENSAATPPPKNTGSFLPINPLVSIWKHIILSILVMVIISLAGIPIAFKLANEQYSVQAVVMVAPRFVKNLKDDQEFEIQSNSQYREFVQQQVKTINRYDIVENAYKKLPDEIKQTWQKENESERQSIERLQGALNIKPVPDTYQITVGLEGHKKAGLAEIVNAVVNSFIEKYKNEEFYGSDQRVKDLENERERLNNDIHDKINRRTKLAQELSVTTLNDSIINPYDQLLTNSKGALAEATRARIVAETQFSAVDPKNSVESKQTLDAMAREIIIKDNGLNSLKASLYQKRSDLLAKISPLGKAHPARIAAEKELTEIDEEIEHASEKLMVPMRKMILDQRVSEVKRTKEVEENLKKQVEVQSSTASQFSKGFQEAINLGADIDRSRKQLDSVQDRLDYLSLEMQAPGFVRLFSAAQTPLSPYKGGGRKKYILLIGLAGVFVGLAVPVGIDFLDPRIRFVRDLEQLLKLPSLGWIIERKDEATQTLAEDQIMRLAASLERDFKNHGTRTFLLTAIKQHSGVSTLTLELAAELTNLGIKTLAVEANAMNPDERYLMDEDESHNPKTKKTAARLGLAGMLALEDCDKSNHSDQFKKLSGKLQIGELKGRRHLPQIQGFKAILEDIKNYYDVVLIDAPPIRLSSDTESLINYSDCTLLVVEAEAVSKSKVKQTVAHLEKLNPNSFGTILNRVQIHRGDKQMKNLLNEYKTGDRTTTRSRISKLLWN
ncbi:MAG: AAA family ATPase [Pyrinomonadaceae bacterium]|nr:AAA family ATPase [Pyrinomonadaceae bacterium]